MTQYLIDWERWLAVVEFRFYFNKLIADFGLMCNKLAYFIIGKEKNLKDRTGTNCKTPVLLANVKICLLPLHWQLEVSVLLNVLKNSLNNSTHFKLFTYILYAEKKSEKCLNTLNS
ncbi:hypothetical protein BpHYR1_011161 [Brachionus plicatilis]|uniref:Uncharacterized protein n=1 Tax=Brachionus plicatilis TaxID=10195 RepID=A0A3M7S8P5_BRAPC|nr:hypothetical protein BpHYR1_011161 [Brachionus plicatilis]